MEERERKPTIAEIKKMLGLDTPVIDKPIRVKKDGKHLYRVAGYFYPLKWETLERLKIPNQKIICEIDREEWIEEMRKAKEAEENTPSEDADPWDVD